MKQTESTKRKIEVLAPAGGPEALRAAVYAGADAVYLGGPAFGARASARNFSREELREAVAFCRARGVRVHVTVNTLLRDSEVPQALGFAEFLCSLPVDAVLVQDMGLFSLLRERAPGLPLHCSTQMSLHTPAGVRLLHGLGASRVVLARELSLPEIEEIAGACPAELESFVHGALCMSVSGQCYCSALLGGRSGNRGMCAQPCRLPFSAPGGTGHDLSLKDLSFITEVRRLEKAGACSAKIEGRMKRPEYVAAAVAACRHAADGEEVPPGLLEKLEAVFSRSGFTQGYLTGRRGRAMFGVRRKEDVTGATEKVFSALRNLYRGERQRVPVILTLSVLGDSVTVSAVDMEGRSAQASAPAGDVPAPLPRGRARGARQKAGGPPFLVQEAHAPEGVPLTVAGVNALRRQALETLLHLRGEKPPIPFDANGTAPGSLATPLAGCTAHSPAPACPCPADSSGRPQPASPSGAVPAQGQPVAGASVHPGGGPSLVGPPGITGAGRELPNAANHSPGRGGSPRPIGSLPLRAAFRSVGQLCPEAKNVQALLLPLETEAAQLERLRAEGWPPVLLELPRAMFGQEDAGQNGGGFYGLHLWQPGLFGPLP